MEDFVAVALFHYKFGLHEVSINASPGPVEVTSELMDFRIKFLKEELQEFIDASETMDHAGMADALIDLVYVALGTAHFFGYPWDELWHDVQRANMTKVRASEDNPGARGHHSFDVIKPKGWVPPDTKGILERHGWETS